MLEWVRGFVIALGGGTVVLIGMLTICKGLFIKFFESGIESSFEKSLERFKNKMERSTRAYEILLDREMRFYERIEQIVAELILLQESMLFCLEESEKIGREHRHQDFCKCFKSYIEQISALQNQCLIHQSYIPTEIFGVFEEVIKQVKEGMCYWVETEKLLYSEEDDAIDYSMGKEKSEAVLNSIAAAETKIQERLKQLCGED